MIPANTRPAPRAHRLRVAIAEDDEDQRVALQKALEAEGFEVLAFEDGFELVDYFAHADASRRWPDAVVTDVGMPGRSGLDAAEQARARGSKVPIFVVTGLPDPQVRERAERLGNALLFQKPIDVDRLAQAIMALASVEAVDPKAAAKP